MGRVGLTFRTSRGLGVVNGSYNETRFDPVKTTRLRLEMDSADRWVATLLEWQVFAAPGAGPVAPVTAAGADRDVMLDGKTYLSGRVRAVGTIGSCRWSKITGPGDVRFEPARFGAFDGFVYGTGNLCVAIGGVTGRAACRIDRPGKSTAATAG